MFTSAKTVLCPFGILFALASFVFSQTEREAFDERIDAFMINSFKVGEKFDVKVLQEIFEFSKETPSFSETIGHVSYQSSPYKYRVDSLFLGEVEGVKEHMLESSSKKIVFRTRTQDDYLVSESVVEKIGMYKIDALLFPLSPSIWVMQDSVVKQVNELVDWEVVGFDGSKNGKEVYFLLNPKRKGGAIIEFDEKFGWLPTIVKGVAAGQNASEVESKSDLERCREVYVTKTDWIDFNGLKVPSRVSMNMSSSLLSKAREIKFYFNDWVIGDDVDKNRFELSTNDEPMLRKIDFLPIQNKLFKYRDSFVGSE